MENNMIYAETRDAEKLNKIFETAQTIGRGEESVHET